MDYQEQYDAYLQRANAVLLTVTNNTFAEDSVVAQAAKYSLISGGKRVRAVLCLAVCEMLCGDMAIAERYAAALEMLHSYSLIHDDLPCMDDDDYRRGQLSCHKKYGEATALLAGDALLTAAFEVLAGTNASPAQNVQAVSVLSHSAGTKGMIRGQELDLHFETVFASEAELREVHRNKTGMLINAAAQLGAIAAQAFNEEKQALENYAFQLGLVFQVVDDVLDVTATQAQLGKPVGSDEKSHKTTFVTLHGVEASKQLAQQLTEEMCLTLHKNFEGRSYFLEELARSLANRSF